MTDELDHLRNMSPPPPRLAAKKRAIAAGLAAFNEAKQGAARAQGNSTTPRLTLASSQSARSRFMRAKTYYALAASVAVVALGAPMAFELWKQRPQAVFGKVSAQLDAPETLRRDALKEAEGAAAPPANAHARTEGDPGPRVDGEVKATPVPIVPPVAPEARGDAGAASVALGKNAAPPLAAARPYAEPQPKGELAQAPVAAPPAPPVAVQAYKARQAAPASGLVRTDGSAGTRTRTATSEVDALAAQADKQAAGAAAPVADTDSRVYSGSYVGGLPDDATPRQQIDEGRDKHPAAAPSPIHRVAEEPVSTFSIDVDTASYAFARREINAGKLPQRDAVRVEEMVNYFPYDYPRPETASAPFKPTVTIAPSPWSSGNKLVHIAIKGYDIQRTERPRANIVLLVDVSGSMEPADRLPLLKNAYKLLINELQPQDTVAIVTYANGVGTALAPTRVAHKQKILGAIERLGAGGGTAGAEGLQRAYQLAQENFDPRGVNRVILGTDGDFNIGISDIGQLKSFIEQKRASGIFLSVLGVGHGNYNDTLMQALAQNGNGTAAYIDTLGEARKVLSEEVSSTLFPIARDVKIQIEFNPAAVSDYRLIGYETRALKREDFNNDKVDAGDIGSGHTVTAIYEITPRGAPGLVDDLRYGAEKGRTSEGLRVAPGAGENEYGFLKLRYKLPDEDTSRLINLPVTRDLEVKRIEDAPREVRFSVAVSAFGQLLQGAPYLRDFGYDQVLALAGGARGEDTFGYRAEFMNLARLAKAARQ